MLRVEKSEKINPNDITIPDRLRAMNEDRVADIVGSFERMGQITPIQVRIIGDGEDVVLIAGRHRLEAARRLGWSHVLMNIVEGDEDDFRLWEIAENLHRSELTVLERSEHIAEWVRLTEKKLGQVAPVSKGGRGQEGGVRAVSRELGVERTDARRAAKVDAIAPEAKQAAREAGLDTNQSALLKVAALPAEEQVAEVERIRVSKAERRPVPIEPENDPVADFVDFVIANMSETAIPTLATYLESGSAKKFASALREL